MAKNIKYINKSFDEFRASLIDYARTYFPTTYNDFSEATPGNLFIEMASYVGDVTSFYLDTQVQENFLLYAKEKENLYAMSYVMGYRPKASYASNTIVDIYQLVPVTSSGGVSSPDFNTYGLIIPANTYLTSTSTGIKFLTTQQVDFTETGSTEITFYDDNNFLFKKSIPAISAEIKTTTITPPQNQKFGTVNISDSNILQILKVTGSGGANDIWYEVPYLAQSSVFEKIANPTFATDQVPYLLQIQRVPQRFVSRLLSDNTLQLEFGAGLSQTYTDSQVIPTANSIAAGSVPGISDLTSNYNEASVFFTQEYGLVPVGNLNVQYLVGGGITSNIPANDLTIIDSSGVYFKNTPGPLSASVLASVISTNPIPSSGGRNGDTVDEIRQNALYSYSTQLRAVTKDDYIVRALSMPSDYGTVAKAYISQDINRNPQQTVATIPQYNPLALDLFILSYNNNKQLVQAPSSLKNNLVTYMNQYRMVTDAINIRDAYYINIGVNFDIIILSGYSNKEVLTNCVTVLQNHFNIDNWQINQPIVLSDITSKLLQVKGVQSVVKLEITNKQGGSYSPYAYDIAGATKNGNVYPSLDPAIFEVRFPNTDIQGRVVTQ